MIKKTYNIEGVIMEIGEPINLKPQNNEKSYKKIVTIKTFDNQILYLDLIRQKIDLLDKNNIQENSSVKAEVTFSGVEKKGVKFNNIYCHNIRLNNK